MPIDWFTVAVQSLNFLILVWLLKRFLYKPILNAIDAREARIARELADADARKIEARQEQIQYQQKNQEFDRERARLFNQASDEAKAELQRLREEAHKEVDTFRAKQQEMLRRDQDFLANEITRKTQDEVFAISRQVLHELAGTELEDRICNLFTQRLRSLGIEARQNLAKAFAASKEPVLVRTAFDPPESLRANVQTAINQTLSADVPIQFVTAPELISGIELLIHDQKVAWNVDHCLKAMEANLGELLKASGRPQFQGSRKIEPLPEPAQETK